VLLLLGAAHQHTTAVAPAPLVAALLLLLPGWRLLQLLHMLL
jgi:hypothetical protein